MSHFNRVSYIISFSILIPFELMMHVGCKDAIKSGTADIAEEEKSDSHISNVGEWLGPLGNFRNGRSLEKGWKQDWFDNEPNLLWKREIGVGVASVSCFEGLVYCVGNKENKEVVQCLDANTNQLIWEYSYPCAIDKRMFEGGSASSPVIDVERGSLYILSHEGELRSLNLDKGKELWKISYQNELKGIRPNWGYASSPLLCDDKLIIVPGGDGTGVVALDPDSGEKIWSTGKDRPGYSSPVQINNGNQKDVMIFNEYGLNIFNSIKGEQLARVRWKTDHGVNATLPLYISGHVFVCSGYGKGGGMFKFNQSKLHLIYEVKEAVCQFQSPIALGKFLYLVIGDNSTKAKLACMRLDNGAIVWTERLSGNRGNVISADGKLIVVSERGEVLLCEASEKGFTEHGRFQAVGGRCWAPPAFADSKLFIRNNSGRLVCYDLKK